MGQIFSHGSPLTDQLTLLWHSGRARKRMATPTLYDP